MSWIKGNRYLNETEMQNNALIIKAYLVSKGWSINAISGMLGNMESESTINPGIWQNLIEGSAGGGGFGLVQWTPWTNFTIWARDNGYEPDDGNAQLKWIDEETESFGQWIATADYNFSFSTFKTSTESPSFLASAFLKNFERAGDEVEAERRAQAEKWHSFLLGNISSTFSPRLTAPSSSNKYYLVKGVVDGGLNECIEIENSPVYGSALPNCVGYAWGRAYEIMGTRPSLSCDDAGTWYTYNDGYERGQTPKLGAIVCWQEPGYYGHVAVVEAIHEDGTITTSNSGWTEPINPELYFWIEERINPRIYGNYVFQGYIYLPISTEPPSPTPLRRKTKKFNFILFNNKRRSML